MVVSVKIRHSLGRRLSELLRRVLPALCSVSVMRGRELPVAPSGPSNSPSCVTGEPRNFSNHGKGRYRTRATIEGIVQNFALRRTKDRRHLLAFDVTPDDDRLPTISCSIRGDKARLYASALERGSRVRVSGKVRTVVYMTTCDIASASQPQTFRCSVAK